MKNTDSLTSLDKEQGISEQNEPKDEELEQELLRFKLLLVQRAPFYGEVLMRIPMLEDRSMNTACTDGRAIFYNPDYMNGLLDRKSVV